MPTQQIVENTAIIAKNTSIIHELQAWASVIFPVVGVIGTVFTWAWGRMQKSIDAVTTALTLHAASNEKLFDMVCTEQREMAEKLNEMYGEHKAFHGKATPPDFKAWAINNEYTGKHLIEHNTEADFEQQPH